MDGPWGHYAKWNKQDRESNYNIISIICEILKKNQAQRYREQIDSCQK